MFFSKVQLVQKSKNLNFFKFSMKSDFFNKLLILQWKNIFLENFEIFIFWNKISIFEGN